MDISLNIIMDSLENYRLETHVKLPSDRKFFSPALVFTNFDNFDKERLYVAQLSAVMNLKKTVDCKDIVFICLRDRISDCSETEELMENTIVVNENMPFEQLYTTISDAFLKIGIWYSWAQNAIINKSSIQDIIDKSENILQNYIQITDSDYKLIAYTRNIDCDDPITLETRKYGYHPEETIKKFKMNKRTDLWQNTDTILINEDRTISNYVLISKVFRFSNTYFAHAVMTCNHRKETAGLIDLFELFIEIITVFVEKEWDTATSCVHVYDSFLLDIFEGNIPHLEIARERGKYINIPVEGKFILSVVSSDQGGKYSVGRIAQEIQSAVQDAKVVLFNNKILILNILSDKKFLEQIGSFKKRLEGIMENYDLRVGMSAVFSNLLDSPRAISQAEQALMYSGCTPGSLLLPEVDGIPNGLQDRIIAFEDSYRYILLGSNRSNRELWKNSVYFEALKTLHEYDKAHDMNNLQLLYVYLLMERRPIETGEKMHMSRNNVVYRIGRIEEMLNMDFSNPAVRVKLIISYTMMELYGLE